MPRNGSVILSEKTSSPPATLTSEASPTCGPTMCAATPNVTGLQGLEAGQPPCASPVGEMTDLFGQARAPANPSVPPARARRPMTAATCGLRGFLSSPSAALQQFLESRLKRQLDGAGSTLFSLTWKARATPAGRPYSQLVASAVRTSGSDCGSWPSPSASGFEAQDAERLKARREECKERTGNGNGFGLTLGQAAMLYASWASPSAGDFKSNEGSEAFHQARAEQTRGKPLSEQAHQLAGWATTQARDWKGPQGRSYKSEAADLPAQAGMLATGSPAQTEKRGQLSPSHSGWLMGYPRAHLDCAPTELPKSKRKS